MWVCMICGSRVEHSQTICARCGANQAGEQEADVVKAALAPSAGPHRGVAYFILTAAATISAVGCVSSLFIAVGALIASNWPVALVLAPLCFVISAALTIVFVRVRDWRPPEELARRSSRWRHIDRAFVP